MNRTAMLLIGTLLASASALADDLLDTRLMSMELARDIADAALKSCRKAGYQVSVVVVDRGGAPQAVLRDVYASGFSIDIAHRKANAVVLSGVSSAEFRRNRAEIVPEMNEIDGILVLDGALPIRAAGALIGAVGVSGAPGGDKDEACAEAGLQAVEERLMFAD